MRKPKNKEQQKQGARPQFTISPTPTVYGGRKKDPENLKRVESTLAQEEAMEEIIIYGDDNALPLRIAQAVEESPAASSCIETIAQFIKGSKFSDQELMEFKVDSNGTTLWDLHCSLAESLALFWGFAVNFKFDRAGKIIDTFLMPFESCRFKKPAEMSPYINIIKYNPYFGTSEYKREFTKEYGVFDSKEAVKTTSNAKKDELSAWPGQVYYYGKTSPTSKFYPKPKYWSAKEAIYADHKLQEFHNEELDNGFFQSVLINAIGDPSQWSKNPRLQKEELQSDGVTKKKVATHTVGEEFNEQMSKNFSGSSKAGTAMVLWSNDANSAIKVQQFPTGINGDRIIATQNSVTKTITIATRVPSILANISEGVSLGSDGNEMQKAVELMQSRTAEWRMVLQNFYNKVLLPNLQKKPGKAQVEIQNYNPITVPVEINKEVWESLNEEEKVAFIKKNMPEIEIIRTAATMETPEPTIDPETGEEVPPVQAPKPNEALKNLNLNQIKRISKIVAQFNTGQLTFEQAKQILMSYGLTEEELNAWLTTPDEI